MQDAADDAAPPDDAPLMAAALAQARRGRPSPEPPEGFILARADGTLIAEGFRADAEGTSVVLDALAALGAAAQGTTLYATLEPNNAEEAGVVDGILAAGVKRVVIGSLYPESTGRGGGADRLRDAGLVVDMSMPFGAEARTLIAPWVKHATTGLPHVALKLALSLDGRIASRSGASKWVTGTEARVKVQQLRSMHDGVAVGIGTALSDDPRLTVRDAALLPEDGQPPVRIIFDTKLRLPRSAHVVDTASDVPTWVFGGEGAPDEAEAALVDAGCRVHRVPLTAEGRVDLVSAFTILAADGIVSVLVEGGAELAGTLLAGQLADELHAFLAPILLGPRGRPGAVDWAGPETPTDAPRVVEPTWEVCGHDAYVHGRLAYPEPED
ncbi:MAG: bifunctional diaminohydroxyphosphoribosylaminopyrimidine deaminase/5-amino-6-(5-phosphoribosylamino)uracil reductase RibD [Myxococcota bacterium]